MTAYRAVAMAIILCAMTLTAVPAVAQPDAAAQAAKARAGDVPAMIALGSASVAAQRTSRNDAEGKRHEAEAIGWFLMAAEKGDAGAMHRLGVVYASRDADDEAPEVVIPAGQERWFSFAAEDDADRTEDPNLQEAVRWFRASAEKGNPQGMFGLGTSYADGSGVAVNGPEALRWLSKAAELGDTDAMVNLGFYYSRGGVVRQDHAEAMRWYHLAADKGNPVAMFTIGVKHHDGDGLPRSYAEAVKWERMAADKGYAAAMLTLGNYYASGEGVEKSEAEALRWYRLAATNGSREAAELLRQRGLEVSAAAPPASRPN